MKKTSWFNFITGFSEDENDDDILDPTWLPESPGDHVFEASEKLEKSYKQQEHSTLEFENIVSDNTLAVGTKNVRNFMKQISTSVKLIILVKINNNILRW